MKRHTDASGFTLIEIAVALVVVTLLAGGVLLATRIQLTQRQTSETRQALEEAREALLAYAAANGHLPCPALGGAPGQGLEGRNNGVCSNLRGLLPWQDLGIQALDGWGHRLAYMPSAPLTVSGFGLTTALGTKGGQVTYDSIAGMVVIGAGGGTGTQLSSAGSVAAAVWSYGANGRFATLTDGTPLPGNGAGPDEQANSGAAGGSTVVSRDESENTSDPGGTFDDQVIWISRYVLFGRMMSAGQLP